MLDFSRKVGLKGPFTSVGPYPSYNHYVYEIELSTLQYSQRLGCHSQTHSQNDTIRKLKSVYGNWLRTSLSTNVTMWESSDMEDKLSRLNRDNLGSLWYHRFNIDSVWEQSGDQTRVFWYCCFWRCSRELKQRSLYVITYTKNTFGQSS